MAEYCGCELPEDLWYDLDYLWARPNDDGTFTLGLTDPAQTMGEMMGDFSPSLLAVERLFEPRPCMSCSRRSH
mgnify:CR=1 FL=1